MRICIFTIGTQGDVRPFAALGRRLRTLGHEVTIVTSDRHRALIDQAGLRHVAIESDFAELMAREQALLDSGNQLKVGRAVARAMTEWMPRWAEQGMDATQDADLVLGSGSGTILGDAVAEKRGLPFVQAQFMPLTPSRHIPPLWPVPRRALPGVANLALSHMLRVATWRLLAEPSQAIRKAFALSPFPWRGPWYSREQRVRPKPVLYAFSRHIQPQPVDWPEERAAVVGFWSLDQAQDWTPTPELRDFLAAGPPPIYVGFGSMLTGRTDSLTQVVLEAIRRSGRRAIVATGWGALQPRGADAPEDVLFIDNVPHDWLFPRVSLAVHHGGAGTTAAATRAGLSQVVVPFVADQFFWAWRLKRIGLSPMMLDRKTMTAQHLADAISLAGGESIGDSARKLGALVRAEDGVANAIEALERWGVLPRAMEPSRPPLISNVRAR
jgi:UDP:flavonoid glycosyltransferase YjiC (YdhE family)